MRRPPRPPTQRLLTASSLMGSLLQGAAMFASVAAVYALGTSHLLPSAQIGALAFTALVAGNLGLILLYRSAPSPWHALRQPNTAFWIVALAAMALLVVVTRLHSPARLFGFVPPPTGLWCIAIVLPLAVTMLLGLLRRQRDVGPAAHPTPRDTT